MKTKFWKQTWFWLMLIVFALFSILLLELHRLYDLSELLEEECFWVALGSIGTLTSVITALCSVIRTENNQKKQETYRAYHEFKNKVFDAETKIDGCEDKDINVILDKKKDIKVETEPKVEWDEVKRYLTQVERIATCVNNGIFDLQMVYNMGGPYMIQMYEKLSPIIHYKRVQDGRNGIYEEFENMVKSLRKLNHE